MTEPFDLDEALVRHPLPEGQIDEALNRAQLGEAFGVSGPTIDKWRTAGMPAREEGGNGRAYVFQLSECWAWYQHRRAEQRAARERGDTAARQMRLQLLSATEQDDPTSGLSPKERREILQAELVSMQAAEARRALMRTEDVAELIEELFATVRQALDALPDRLEREAGIGPDAVGRAVGACDQVLMQMRSAIARAHLEERDHDSDAAALPGLV
ncbi:DUF1441 family protein [Oceanicella sp. SM1341]|uniref:DUF1441 family protein n=1 Tax=Oceanicella sp. SM1341 TaxID=1548889 RepID=UPI000E4C9667|nr:DUF1441 family protein [Oceanicella sp. SM1341]